jgi:hypothetical protein
VAGIIGPPVLFIKKKLLLSKYLPINKHFIALVAARAAM